PIGDLDVFRVDQGLDDLAAQGRQLAAVQAHGGPIADYNAGVIDAACPWCGGALPGEGSCAGCGRSPGQHPSRSEIALELELETAPPARRAPGPPSASNQPVGDDLDF